MTTSPTLSTLAFAVTLALAPTAFADILDASNQNAEGSNSSYERVLAKDNNTATVTADSVTVTKSSQAYNEALILATTNGTINFGSADQKLSEVKIQSSFDKVDNTDTSKPKDYPQFAGAANGGDINIYANKYIQDGSGHGLVAYKNSSINLLVDSFTSNTAYSALHARQGDDAIINVGSTDHWLQSFSAKRTEEVSGVSLLQVNEGAQINIFAKDIALNAPNGNIGGGALGTGSWGSINLTADTLTINGSIDGDYGATSASNEGDEFVVNITTNKLQMAGDIHSGSNGSNTDAPSQAYNRTDKVNITATDKDSFIEGNIVAYNTSETTINFINGGTLKGDISTNNINQGQTSITSTSKVTLDGKMTYEGEVDLKGESNLVLAGDIDGQNSTINSSEDSSISVQQTSSFKTVTSDSSKGVDIGSDASLAINSSESSISNLTNNGTLALSGNATAKLTKVAGQGTIQVDSKANTVTIDQVAENSSVTAKGTANFNNNSGSTADALKALTETITSSTADTQVVSNVTVAEGDINGAGSATVADDGTLDNVQTAVNTKWDAYQSINSLVMLQWRHDSSDLTKRMGDLRSNPGQVGSWARIYGSEHEYGAQGVQNKNTSIQVGADYAVTPEWKVGAAFSYTDGSSTYGQGDGDNKAYGFAAYGTWLAENGQYVDLVAKYSYLDNDFSLGGLDGSYSNNAFSVSAEYGWHLTFHELGFVEPQVQLTYGKVLGDNFTAGNRVKVEQGDFDSFVGRLGVRGGFQFPNNKGSFYARASVLHDFQGDMDTTVSNAATRQTFKTDIGGTWYEYGVGANFNFTNNAYLYVDLERATGGDIVENWRWNVGARLTF